jgi:uncharacterized protein (DUF2267 family)
MDYQRLVQSVRDLSFIQDDRQADDAVKAVLGVLVCAMDEEKAAGFVGQLPEPLEYERFAQMQLKSAPTSADEFGRMLRDEYGLSQEQSHQLIDVILREVKDGLDEETLWELEEKLPSEWVAALEEA